MKNRILYVSLKNIKSVNEGRISFYDEDIVNTKDLDDSNFSMLGVYGQNGSGKTTLYNCFELLKMLSMDKSIYSFDNNKRRVQNPFSYLVSLFAEEASIEYGFLINNDGKSYKVIYTIVLEKKMDEKSSYINIKKEKIKIYNFHENGERWKYPFAPLEINYNESSIDYLYDNVKHQTQNIKVTPNIKDLNLAATKKYCSDYGFSYIFSKENISYLVNNEKNDVPEFGKVIAEFKLQLGFRTFIFNQRHEALYGNGIGAIIGTNRISNSELHGSFLICLKPFYIAQKDCIHFEGFIKQINVFISSFVPGFMCEIKKLGSRQIDGRKEILIQIVRKIGKDYLPLSEESSGIRKLFLLTCGLIYIYGDENGWLIVDELDSGVYEDLLGQILTSLENSGKGQLLFTAHNLVPLERISPNFVCFTTFNSYNRYINIKGLSKTSNLRDVYLRQIKLGGQSEPLSSNVEVYDIENALYQAYKTFKELGKNNG